jgi:prepilin-type N-terminal cleavage/methylation domain-containing protein
MNRRSKYLNNHGYTLIEIVIVIVILGIIGAFTFQMVAAGVQAFRKSSARKELSDQGRLALERMAREIRDAYQIQATQSTADEFTFKRKHPGESADNIEEIKFWLDGTDLKRVGDPNGTPVEAALASNISGFTVTSMVPGAGGGGSEGITLDNVTSRYSSGTGDLAHVIGSGSGNNRLLVVCYGQESYSTVDSMTYNGAAMTKIHREYNSEGAQNVTEMWYILDADMPASAGTYNVSMSVTGGNNPGIVVLSFEGVAQQAPEIYNSSQYTSNASDRSTTQISNVSVGSLIVSLACNGSSNGYDGSVGGVGGAGIRQSEGQPSSAGMGVSTDLSSAGGTFNVVEISELSPSTTLRATHIVAAFAPAPAAPGGGPGVVQVDSVSSAATPTATDSSLTISHTTGNGDDRLMLVGVSLQNGDYEYVTGVTYNSAPLALVGAEARDDDSRIEIWKLVSPESGTHDVVITFNETLSNGATAGVMTFTGVDPATPHGTFTSNNGYSSAASITIPSANDELVFAVAVAEDQAGPLTTGAGQDERWSIGADGYDSAGAGSTEAGAANVSMSWTVNTSQDWVVGAVFLRQTRMVKLDLTLNSEEGGTLHMRTKVYMRNYQ